MDSTAACIEPKPIYPEGFRPNYTGWSAHKLLIFAFDNCIPDAMADAVARGAEWRDLVNCVSIICNHKSLETLFITTVMSNSIAWKNARKNATYFYVCAREAEQLDFYDFLLSFSKNTARAFALACWHNRAGAANDILFDNQFNPNEALKIACKCANAAIASIALDYSATNLKSALKRVPIGASAGFYTHLHRIIDQKIY